MKRKKASEIFGPVDPGLTVIDRGRRGKKKAKTLAEVAAPPMGPYNPQPMTEEGWEKSEGAPCPICGQNTLRLYHYGYSGEDKACKNCIDERREIMQYKRDLLASRR
ncbi:unnamed protein product [marine sediment metagenome]|uniref:Uncharacterized protein n=1 Tax=marine sediment metagenome TaxID=412755 RepID=X1L8L2_9ZZZZ